MSIERAIVRDPQSAEFIKGQALAARSDLSRALPLFRTARGLDPDSATLVAHEAMCLLDLGEPVQVISLLTGPLRRWPRHVHIANLLGVALYQRDHHRQAIRLFEHCLGLDDEYAVAGESLTRSRGRLSKDRPAKREVSDAIDAVLEAARGASRPTLAVCMIVKDEAEFIKGALDSTVGLADEVIVVDTGSTDDTVALCRAAGARVEFFPWTGDFSEARNVSIELATADWIFILDADERIQQGSRSVIRALMEERGEGLKVICPRILNMTRTGQFLSDGYSGRMFRNDPRLRFSGRVHEEVGCDMRALSTDYRLDVVLDHYGADPDVVVEKGKDARNLELLEARLAERPDELMTWFYLGSQHWIGRRVRQAAEAFERVVELFERDPSRYGMAVIHVPVSYSFVGLTRSLVAIGDLERAATVAKEGLGRFPENPDLWFQAAFVHIAKAEFEPALVCLERAQSADVAGYALIGMHDQSIQAWRAERTIADIEFEHGDRTRAYPLYLKIYEQVDEPGEKIVIAARLVELCAAVDDAPRAGELTLRYLKLRPEQSDVALQMARWLARSGKLQQAYDLLTQLFDQIEALRAVPELGAAIAEVAEEAGEPKEALRWYDHVATLEWPEPRFWLNYARSLIGDGRAQEGAEAMAIGRRLMGADLPSNSG